MNLKHCLARRISAAVLTAMMICLPLAGYIDTAGAASAQTYFVSFSQGNDTNSGTSPGAPWKSFTNLRNMILQPGDRVLLRRGDTWHSRLTLSPAGTADSPVYVGPYGDIKAPAPKISMTNGRDDICIVVQDLINTAPYNTGVKYIHIDNLQLTDSRVGIYFRNAVSAGNKGIQVTNCYFENMNCEPVMTAMLEKDRISTELNMSKGDLDQYIGYYQETGGGNSEYVWPVAIMIGGRRSVMELRPGFSDIEIVNNIFEQCVTGVLAYYYNMPSSTNFFKNMRFTDCQISGTVNGIMAVMAMDAGNKDLSPSNRWGVFKNLNIIGGSTGQGFALGTTGLIIEDVANALFTDCNFSNVRNNGNPDGCGFDFESRGRNITITDSIFANNDGQAILMMDNHDGNAPHSNVTIRDSLFYNNLQNVNSDSYRWDMCVWNSGNKNISLIGNRHVSKVRTAGKAVERINSDEGFSVFEKPRGYGSKTEGMTETGASFRRNDTLTDFSAEVSSKGLADALKTVTLVQKTNLPSDATTPTLTTAPTSKENSSQSASADSASTSNQTASATSSEASSVSAGSSASEDPGSGRSSNGSAQSGALSQEHGDSSASGTGNGGTSADSTVRLVLIAAAAFVLAMALAYLITAKLKK